VPRRRRTSAVTAGAGLALLLLPAASTYLYLIRDLPSRESEGLNEFVHRALASNPLSTMANELNVHAFWSDSPWLNKALMIAGLVAVVAAAILARPGGSGPEPAHPADPQIA
jgi:hypothetical protein